MVRHDNGTRELIAECEGKVQAATPQGKYRRPLWGRLSP